MHTRGSKVVGHQTSKQGKNKPQLAALTINISLSVIVHKTIGVDFVKSNVLVQDGVECDRERQEVDARNVHFQESVGALVPMHHAHVNVGGDAQPVEHDDLPEVPDAEA